MNREHCGKSMIMAEYDYGHPYRYDGVSEIFCRECGYRECRWCEKELKPGEIAPPHCEGKGHPVFTSKE